MANEVPEIVWLSPNEYRSNELSCFWSESKRTDYDIEYTRTDAFIEKAVNYLNSKLYDWVRIEHLNPSVSPKSILKQDFIEDFKTYIKGE